MATYGKNLRHRAFLTNYAQRVVSRSLQASLHNLIEQKGEELKQEFIRTELKKISDTLKVELSEEVEVRSQVLHLSVKVHFES